MATIEHLSSSASADDIVAIIERDGAVILDNVLSEAEIDRLNGCLLYTSPSPRDYAASRMPSSA